MAATASASSSGDLRGLRLLLGYAVVTAFLVVAFAISISVGNSEDPPIPVAGFYTSGSTCLGDMARLEQSGVFVDLDGPGQSEGKLRLDDERLTGDVTCADGSTAEVDLTLAGEETERTLRGTVGGENVAATFSRELPEPGIGTAPAKKRSGEETFGRLMLAIAAIILAARLVGVSLRRLGQPQVMGEVLAGILLGPTLLGAIAPEVKDYLFPADIVPLLSGASQIGLAFYLFLVGMEIDPRILRERVGQALFISNTSVAFPLALGFLAALVVYPLLAPDVDFLPFALFMGVSMSITAFPVLARILIERRMLKRPVGALAMAGAAIDDVTAWGLLALATAVAGTGSGSHVFVVIGLAVAFTAGMFILVRPLLKRVSTAYDEVGRVPPLWLGAIFVAVLLSAFLAQKIGIAAIFGAFVMGLIMPRHAGLTDDVSQRLEDFVVMVLLPLFFIVTGLRTEVGSLNRPVLWLITLGLIAVAIVGKWVGAMAAARYGGFGFRESAAIGALMNTRGLTELIVLNIGLELGLVSPTLFTMLVIMALVTTFMAGPALRLIDPHKRLSSPPEEEVHTAMAPEGAEQRHSVVVSAQDSKNLDALLAIAEPLAATEPPRELIIARLVVTQAIATGPAADARELRGATEEVNTRRDRLRERGIEARAVAFTTPDPGEDLVHLGSDEYVDLLLVDGRRPLLGPGVPAGEIGAALERAPCDVGVLVEREGLPQIDAEDPVVVPFGGAEHDWAALELGSWIAAARGAPLKLLGASAENGEGRDASRLLANASLVVQQLAGIAAEPVLTRPGPAVIRASEGAGLLVVGLSERWREEGLGPVRAEIVKAAPAPILLVRRGTREGALAPRDDMTRFRWSRAG
jgi:Kef-type K+ transport system membrane component KefB